MTSRSGAESGAGGLLLAWFEGAPRKPWALARKADLSGYAFPAASLRIIQALPDTYREAVGYVPV